MKNIIKNIVSAVFGLILMTPAQHVLAAVANCQVGCQSSIPVPISVAYNNGLVDPIASNTFLDPQYGYVGTDGVLVTAPLPYDVKIAYVTVVKTKTIGNKTISFNIAQGLGAYNTMQPKQAYAIINFNSGGTVTAGKTYNVTVNGVALSYTTNPGDGANTINSNFQNLINNNPTLQSSMFAEDNGNDTLHLVQSYVGAAGNTIPLTVSDNDPTNNITTTGFINGADSVGISVVSGTTATAGKALFATDQLINVTNSDSYVKYIPSQGVSSVTWPAGSVMTLRQHSSNTLSTFVCDPITTARCDSGLLNSGAVTIWVYPPTSSAGVGG